MMNKLPIQINLSSRARLIVKQGDLTQEPVDVIVNAANRHLEHGGGIARLISVKGGPTIDQDSRAWIRDHGQVSHEAPAVTTAGNLPAKYVFHAVGPVWGSGNEESKLESAVKGCLQKMEDMRCTSIAFPAISTGIFGFPKSLAAAIFYQTFKQYFTQYPDSSIESVYLVLFDTPTIEAFVAELDTAFPIGQ